MAFSANEEPWSNLQCWLHRGRECISRGDMKALMWEMTEPFLRGPRSRLEEHKCPLPWYPHPQRSRTGWMPKAPTRNLHFLGCTCDQVWLKASSCPRQNFPQKTFVPTHFLTCPPAQAHTLGIHVHPHKCTTKLTTFSYAHVSIHTHTSILSNMYSLL